jgi:hypothetical protein
MNGEQEDSQRKPGQNLGATVRALRKNLLLTASIESEKLKTLVRIRNLSESGAMLDGAVFPEVGAELILRRMDVEIGASVVWRRAGRCGVTFDGAVSVDEWVVGARLPGSRRSHGQARVDAIQAEMRCGKAPISDEPGPLDGPIQAGLLDSRIAEELGHVRRLLEAVGDELTDDALIVQRHGRALQNFDIACQIVAHLGTIIGATDRDKAVGEVTMEDLRTRLFRARIF